jgi:ADP-ribose pyrophosphatase YjhB (NUDIX family)
MSPREHSLTDDGRNSPQRDFPSQRAVRIRPAGRVVLLDPDNRVLLMRYDDPPPNGVHWSTPGGGLNPGEDFKEGAARELAEETGWHNIVLLGEIHRWTHTMEYDDAIVRQAERFFLARTDRPQRQITGVEAMHKSDGIARWRWWALDEVDNTNDAIWPAELPELIRKTLARASGVEKAILATTTDHEHR